MLRLEASLARLQRWDAQLCLRTNRCLQVRSLSRLLRAISWLGNGIFWYALMLSMLLADPGGAALPVMHMAFAGAVGAAAYKMVKRGTSRPRPFEVLAQVKAGTAPLDAYSFPSGHTLHAVAFTVVALAYWPGLAPLLVPFTLATAASRVALGLHYPSDVLAGAALGALIGGASFALA
jgi:undecaprenyl-diphosphatase